MIPETWVPWAAVGIAAAVHLVATLTSFVYGSRSGMMAAAKPNGNQDEDVAPRYLDPRAVVLIRGFQAASLVAAALGIAGGMSTPGGLDVDGLIVGGIVAILGRTFLHAIAAWVAHRYRNFLRVVLAPSAWTFSAVSSLPGTAWLASVITGRNSDDDRGEEVSAAIKEGLGLLEEARIPADEEELRMIRGILRMDTVKVREIMRPRVDVVAAPVESEPGAIADLMAVGGYSKIPVYTDSLDNIEGVVYARDLLNAMEKGEPPEGLAKRLARPAIFVPESQSLERLLQEFQQHRTSIAVVIDEYGGVSGLVTVTDLIEEIVGELEDEFDVDEPELERVSETVTIADAGLSIDALNQALGIGIEANGFDTVGGLVYRELGKMPTAGDRVQVDGIEVTVQSTVGRRIRRVRVEKRQPASA
ncbi:MAG: hemolysin family protein [Dehalococcoidia bacterium]